MSEKELQPEDYPSQDADSAEWVRFYKLWAKQAVAEYRAKKARLRA